MSASNADKPERDREFVRGFEARIAADIAESRSLIRRYVVRCSIACAAMIAITVAVDALFHINFGAGIVAGFTTLLITPVAITGADSIRRRAADRLRSASDPRLTGVLATYYSHDWILLREAARGGLRRALPGVRAEHRDAIGSSGIRALARHLLGCADISVVNPLVEALTKLGDPAALAEARKFARGTDCYMNLSPGSQSCLELRRAAEACVRELEARAEQERIRESLLRPADSPSPDESLLRPASGRAAVGAELLRPTESGVERQTTSGLDS